MEDNKKLNKLKNKKKDVIMVENEGSNKETVINNEDKNEAEQKAKHNTQERTKVKDPIELNKENIQIFDKIIFQIQLLFSICDRVDEKLSSALIKFLSKGHLAAILEERDCQSLCGNFNCGKKVTVHTMKFYFDSKVDKVHIDDILEMFCDVRCFQKFKEYSKIVEKFDYFTFLNLESLFLLSNLNQFYPENQYLSKISNLSNNVIEKFLKARNITNAEEMFKSYRLNLCKYFIDDFDKIITSDEFKENLQLNLIF